MKKVKKKSPKKKDTRFKKKPVEKTEEEKALALIENEEAGVDLDPRRQKFAAFYLDPSSTTYCNALQSAIRAGFTEEYSKTIISRKTEWISDIIRKLGIIDKLKSNLEYHTNLDPMTQAMGAFGPLFHYTEKKVKVKTKDGKTKTKIKKVQGDPIMVESNSRLKLRQEITMWALEKLDPDFKKREKEDFDPQKVEIKQIIILAPNGERIPYNKSGAEAIKSILGPAR